MKLSSRVLAAYLFYPESRRSEKVFSVFLQRGTSVRALRFNHESHRTRSFRIWPALSARPVQMRSSAHTGSSEYTSSRFAERALIRCST